MQRVIIESPLGAPDRDGVEFNKLYARRCVRDSLKRGEAPYASHLFFDQPGILDDMKPDERENGIAAGFAWGEAADMVVFYIDRGISPGMIRGFERAVKSDAEILVRSLETNVSMYVPLELELGGTYAWEEAGKRNLANLHQAAASIIAPDASSDVSAR